MEFNKQFEKGRERQPREILQLVYASRELNKAAYMREWLHSIDWVDITASALILVIFLIVVVPAFNALRHDGQPANNAANYSAENYIDPSAPEERLANYTLWLERFTALLAIVSAAQMFFLVRADNRARLAFIASARPKIIVRRVEALFLMPPQRVVSVQFAITNVGGSRAYLVERKAIVLTAKGELKAVPQFPAGNAISDETILESGDFYVTTAARADPNTDPTQQEIRQGLKPLYVYGQVRYRDETGTVREMGFGRNYDSVTGRFSPLDDPEYEYGD